MQSFELLLLAATALILISIGVARHFEGLGLPILLLFLGLGMLAGAEGPGRFYFDNVDVAQRVGVVCLTLILFAGGLETRWREVRPLLGQAAALATVGVLLTALAVAAFVHWGLGQDWKLGLLLGAIISSTDAAAVFSVLRSKAVRLRGQLRPLLELESGSNDPMAVFLTVGMLLVIQEPGTGAGTLGLLFVREFGLGAALGLGLGKGLVWLLNNARFSHEGFYPVFTLAYALAVYALAHLLGGSGFLAVYMAAILVGNNRVARRNSIFRFFDGLAWLSQIAMFLTLGLLVFPSQLWPVTGAGLAVSAFLMLVARPLGVYAVLAFTRWNWREKALIGWVGLRGAVPIVLATYALQAGVPNAGWLFNVVFFTVLTSALLQGWSIPLASGLSGCAIPPEEEEHREQVIEYFVPAGSPVAGRSLVNVGLPFDVRVLLISRGDGFVVPRGGTVLEEGDVLMTLVPPGEGKAVQAILAGQPNTQLPQA